MHMYTNPTDSYRYIHYIEIAGFHFSLSQQPGAVGSNFNSCLVYLCPGQC